MHSDAGVHIYGLQFIRQLDTFGARDACMHVCQVSTADLGGEIYKVLWSSHAGDQQAHSAAQVVNHLLHCDNFIVPLRKGTKLVPEKSAVAWGSSQHEVRQCKNQHKLCSQALLTFLPASFILPR